MPKPVPPPLLFDNNASGTLTVRVLQHAALYRFTTPHVVAKVFPDIAGESKKDKVVAARELLESLVSDARLEKSASQATFFEQNAYLYPGVKLKEGDDLARLWFCCMGPIRRYYADYETIKPLFEAESLSPPHHNFFHAFTDEEGGPVLFRLYLCRAEMKHFQQKVRTILKDNQKKFPEWQEEGSYGIAVIVQSKAKKNEVKERLKKRYGGKPSLDEQARFIVSVVPDENDYEAAVKKLGGAV